jgi:hypothetical protein
MFHGRSWMRVTEDRAKWQEVGETYVQQSTVVGWWWWWCHLQFQYIWFLYKLQNIRKIIILFPYFDPQYIIYRSTSIQQINVPFTSYIHVFIFHCSLWSKFNVTHQHSCVGQPDQVSGQNFHVIIPQGYPAKQMNNDLLIHLRIVSHSEPVA